MPYLQEIKNGQFVVTIPRAIVLAKKWGKGTNLKFEIGRSGNLVLLEVPNVASEVTSQVPRVPEKVNN